MKTFFPFEQFFRPSQMESSHERDTPDAKGSQFNYILQYVRDKVCFKLKDIEIMRDKKRQMKQKQNEEKKNGYHQLKMNSMGIDLMRMNHIGNEWK